MYRRNLFKRIFIVIDSSYIGTFIDHVNKVDVSGVIMLISPNSE